MFKKNLMYLNLLVNLNLIEYHSVNSTTHTHKVYIKHYGGLPVLKGISFIGDTFNGGVSKIQWKKEMNTKRALYIAYTNKGVAVIDSLNPTIRPTKLLFRLEIL